MRLGKYSVLLSFLFPLLINAKTIRIAVIDSGFDFQSNWSDAPEHGLAKPKLCKDGHKDFTGFGLQDHFFHGTHIAGLIAKNNKNVDYCLIILKFYEPKQPKIDNLVSTINALKYALSLNVTIINYSAGGEIYSEKECSIIKKIIDNKIMVVTASGNEGQDLYKDKFYPANCDDKTIKVMNIDKQGKRLPTSNYDSSGTIKNLYSEMGDNVLSLCPNNSYCSITGTSQSAASFTGRLIHEYSRNKK